MTEIGVMLFHNAYQMTRLDEANTLVPFLFLLVHSGKKKYCQNRPNMPLKNGPGRLEPPMTMPFRKNAHHRIPNKG